MCEEHTLSYAALNARANQLAHLLIAQGAGPEQIVGFAAALGRHDRRPARHPQGGAAYLPLDPDYPADRLAFMLDDAGAALVVTQAALLERIPAHAVERICLDADRAAIARNPASAPANLLAPQNPAYVIYTSGSTGLPKGVVVSHPNVTSSAGATESAVSLQRGRRLRFSSPLASTASIWDLGALLMRR